MGLNVKIEKKLKYVRCLPTWLITNIVCRFVPKEHIWYKKRFGVFEWEGHQTKLCSLFDYLLWLSLIQIFWFLLI
jgi:hypothetical protein